MRISIFGASGAGVTTLGRALAQDRGYGYLDSDDYLWLPTDPPFTTKRDKDERNISLTQAIAENANVVLGGSVVSWNLEILTSFDLAVFLYVPTDLRLTRLKERETARFGDALINHATVSRNFKGLLEWAAGYDTDTACGRGLPIHENWITQTSVPVLEIRGDTTVAERLQQVLARLSDL